MLVNGREYSMTPRNFKRIIIGILAVAMLGLSIHFGFGDAWQSQYMYASTPVSLAQQHNEPMQNSSKPPVSQEPDSNLPDKVQPLSKRIVEYHMLVNLRDDLKHIDG